MSEAIPRVALLARPGEACERIREALDAIGAQVVLVGNPLDLPPEQVSASAAQTVVVALDPATEDALDRFDDLFAEPRLQVLYEEADLAVRREGWEAARWRRHLAAKLFGHGDVLPPAPDGEPAPVGASAPTEPHAAAPTAQAPSRPPAPEPALPPPLPATALELEPVADAPAMTQEPALPPPLPATTLALEPVAEAPAADTGSVLSFDPVAAEYGDFEGADQALELSISLPDVDTVSGDFAIELDTPPLNADNSGLIDLTFEDVVPRTPAEPVVAESAVPPPLPEPPPLPPLSLEQDAAPAAPVAEAPRKERFQIEMADLEKRISSLSLVDERVPSEDNGAVLVLAGIGGPDAVRQLLAALPREFARPVLVRQRLDAGRYDKLVAQMQRVSAMPVKLAEPGMAAEAGVVYFLPPEIGLEADGGARRFHDRGGDVLAALPAPDSAVLLLSGADPADVDSVLSRKAAGAMVLGQSPEGCFDTAAIDALIARGGATGAPAELAARLAERWRQRATFGDGT